MIICLYKTTRVLPAPRNLSLLAKLIELISRKLGSEARYANAIRNPIITYDHAAIFSADPDFQTDRQQSSSLRDGLGALGFPFNRFWKAN